MNCYIGCKLVEAESMTRGVYNQLRGWQIPDNENPEDEGYLVKYDNDYISWSPKNIFEKHYFMTSLSKEEITSGEEILPEIKDLDRFLGKRKCQAVTFTKEELEMLDLPMDYKSKEYEVSYDLGGFNHNYFGTKDEIEEIDECLQNQAWFALVILTNLAINGFKKGNE